MDNIIIREESLTLSTIEVAGMVGKRHDHLLRDIGNYIKNFNAPKFGEVKIDTNSSEYLRQSNIGVSDFFIESSYLDSKNEKRICYQITRKGCEFIANKLTGQKGTLFTATYINIFHEMENKLENPNQNKSNNDRDKKLEIQEMNARTRMASVLLKLSNVDTLSKEYKNILVSKATEVLTGSELIALPKSEQKTYSATEVGEIFGVSSQKIGSLANKYNIKTNEYGEWYRDKSRYSNKEVDTFRYYDSAINIFEEILKY